MITAHNIQYDVFFKNHKEAKEQDKMMGREGRRKRAGRSVPAFLARRAGRESAVRISAATIEIC